MEHKDQDHNLDDIDKAVHRVFAILGVDVDNPESVSEFQDSIRFLRRLKRITEHGILAFAAIAAAATAAVIWEGVISKLKKLLGGGH